MMVDRFFTGIDAYRDEKLTDLKWHIEDDKQPASYYIENGETASFRVVLEYTIDWGKEVHTAEFEVPKEVDGAFIIEGAYRIATNTLGNDYDCRINMSGTGRHYINFDYDREYDMTKGILKIKRVDPSLGLSEKVREYPLDEIDKVSGLEREALKLSDKQRKKFQVKLDIDYEPEYISKKLIEDCMSFGDDRVKDLIIDKKIESVPKGFEDYLYKGGNKRNFYGTKRKITNYWTRYGRLQDKVNVLTMLCNRHWKGSSDAGKGGSDVQISPGVNSVNLQSITDKILIPESVAYNTTFSDMICIGDTPINQNVGKQNSLTVSTHITDDDTLFDVLDPEFTKITIPYLDYLNKKVCASEYVDYETKQLKPNEKGEVEVKYRMKRKMVPVSEVELVDLHPDYRLSETVRRIPFMNYCDSVRIHMGSSMLKQSIPIANAERPLVDTGNFDELSDNVLNDKFRFKEGKVKEITEDKVIIELPDGDETYIPRRTAIHSVHDVDVYTEPKVKVGQKVKEGDIITGAVGLEKDTYKSGLNALCLFHAMFGLVNEDALVISESFADRLKSYTIMDISMDIKVNTTLKDILPIGTVVKSGDKVMTTYSVHRLNENNKALNDKLGGIFGQGADFSEYTTEQYLTIPNNIPYAVVSDVMVQRNLKPKIDKGRKMPDLTFALKSQEVVDAYDMNRKVIYDKYPEYVAADRLKPIDMSGTSYRTVYTVRIRLIMTTPAEIGSKITNRYGGKGVVSKVLPDDQMPIMVDKQGKKHMVDCILNPYSTINRRQICGYKTVKLLENK